MGSAPPEHDLFRPKPSRTESRAEATDRGFRAITESESKRQAAKTARLRQARLEMEAARGQGVEGGQSNRLASANVVEDRLHHSIALGDFLVGRR